MDNKNEPPALLGFTFPHLPVSQSVFSLAAEEAKAANTNHSQEEIEGAIDEALKWARQ